MEAVTRHLCVEIPRNTLRSYPFSFLLPAFQQRLESRPFSSSATSSSQIGRAPVSLPENVALRLIEPVSSRDAIRNARQGRKRIIEIEGPLGKLAMPLPAFVEIEQDMERHRAMVKVHDPDERKQRAMWGTWDGRFTVHIRSCTHEAAGTTRAYLQNHIMGVSEGHTAILRMVGVGFRAVVGPEAITLSPKYPGQQFVSLKVGYAHPVELGVPEGVRASTPQPTRILLEGMDKEVILSFAAKIRAWRRPEPYKGKGIFVNGETIKLKAKKIK
ncbi:MAG: hypothetical protein M1816_007503 [Peltula sp. TS41687]|nr:MAG: hypothetical protein M1816_007503 [Peltula sp. TS41687]